MKRVFAPGCGLMLYKPHYADKLDEYLNRDSSSIEQFHVCCHHEPGFKEPTEVINVCPGCDKRFRQNYENCSTISLWEILAAVDDYPFLDYGGTKMSIIDACPTRGQTRVHQAVRTLLNRMNIQLVEPKNTGTRGTCCGDSAYGLVPDEELKAMMQKRAGEMPAENVVVYCVSCIKSMHIGGRKPRYLIDLLFGEDTEPQIYEPRLWHKQLEDYIEQHKVSCASNSSKP
ncbi:MAG TPA: (Fe-S)-binding protein [Acidobacteriota bacterium]|nr:(Fe-S)-binding protein [Acidobacteriota bacterium]